MDVEVLARYVTNALFAMIFLVVVARAIRQRNRVWIETALFFGCAAILVAGTSALFRVDHSRAHLLDEINVLLLLVMGYLLVRLVDNLSVISPSLMRSTAVGFGLLILAVLVKRDADSPYVFLPVTFYFGMIVVFAAIIMAAAGLRSNGVERRRMLAVSTGSLFLSLTVVFSGVRSAFPLAHGISHPLIGGPLALTSGLSYFIGLATPRFVRRAWQDRILREFFMRTMTLSRVSDVTEIVFGLETAIRRAHGGSPIWITLWDEQHQSLKFTTQTDRVSIYQPDRMIEGRVFSQQQATISTNLQRDDPANAALYRELGVNAMICAPVSAGDRKFGALAVYSARAPMFQDDDLEVVGLMADKAATVLESHALIEQSTRMRAREEATRLKDEFLAGAAHDLRNPLTAVVMQAQLIQRRARRHPDEPVDPASIQRLIDQANRLQTYVSDLLDVQRMESQGMIIEPSEVDLAQLVIEAARLIESERHTVRRDVQTPMFLLGDRARLIQLIDNLLSNAVKYSPDSGEIVLRLWREGGNVHLVVRDFGIGIPATDIPHVFDRFHRAGNIEGAQLHGVGLGLFICRMVAEAHGGTISVTSEPGQGSEFHVVLPAGSEPRIQMQERTSPSDPGEIRHGPDLPPGRSAFESPSRTDGPDLMQ